MSFIVECGLQPPPPLGRSLVKVFASLGQMQNVSLFGAPTSQLGLVPEDTQQGISLLDEDRQGD